MKAAKVGVYRDAVGDAEDGAVVKSGFAGGLDDDFLELAVVKIRQQGVLRDSAPQSKGGTGQLAGLGQGGVALWRAGDAGRGERRKQPADGAAGAGNQRFGLRPGV